MSGPVVTQAARDAAAQRMASNPQARKLAELFVAGEYDGHGLVQAFARFEAEIRTAAEAAAKEREDVLVEALAEIERRCADFERINLGGKSKDAKFVGTIRNIRELARHGQGGGV